MNPTWRLLVDDPATGAWNMAVDEAVFKAVESEVSPPTLRFYRWRTPTISLGFGQSVDKSVDRQVLAEEGIDLVRRHTGGKAVLHDDEVTYSFSARHYSFPQGLDLLDSYRVLTEAFAAGLGRMGMAAFLVPRKRGSLRLKTAVCFAIPASYELLVQGRKVLGSAQRRTRKAFLQHGSLPLMMDLALLYRCLHPGGGGGESEAVTGRWQKEMAGLSDVAGRPLDWGSVVEALVQGVKEKLGVNLQEGKLSLEEKALSESLLENKYSNPDWTYRR